MRRNYPYRGQNDGLTRWLRMQFDDATYCGVELEINQKHVRDGRALAPHQRAAVAAALCEALDVKDVRRSGFP